jgi:two-component system, sensor histidine kinase PdtaS
MSTTVRQFLSNSRGLESEIPEGRSAASYERELRANRVTEIRLREALAGEEVLLEQMDKLAKQHEALSQEADHRLLNCLQMIASLLSMQSRGTRNEETQAQLAVAANRVTTIERVHRRLHSFDGVRIVAFRPYLEELCRDFSTMLSREVVLASGFDVNLPGAAGIPLGFIVNELITNAAKHGNGRITVTFESRPEKSYVLSVSNEGPALPEGFDPAASHGLGMRIITSFVERMGAELQIGRNEKNEGARFAVLFSSP